MLATVFSLEALSIATDLAYLLKKVEAYAFHSTDRHPSTNAYQPVRLCATIVDERETEGQLGMLPVLSC